MKQHTTTHQERPTYEAPEAVQMTLYTENVLCGSISHEQYNDEIIDFEW